MQPPDTTAQCHAIPSPANLTSTDNCDSAPVVSLSTSQLSGVCADQYVLTRRWTATDACGNAFQRAQTIAVQDTNAPTFISSLANTSVACNLVSSVNESDVRAVDSCDPSPQVTFTQTNQTGSCAHQFIMRQQWTATDRCGNSARFVRNVAVFVSHDLMSSFVSFSLSFSAAHLSLSHSNVSCRPCARCCFCSIAAFACTHATATPNSWACRTKRRRCSKICLPTKRLSNATLCQPLLWWPWMNATHPLSSPPAKCD